jgi:hypothetical protein
MAVRILETHNITTRKSAKTNGNTDGNIPLGIFADGYNSVSKFVGIYRLYRRWTMQCFWKVAAVWWHGFFQTILPTELLRDSNRDSRIVTWHFHRRNHWQVYRQNVSIGDSISKSHYIPTLPTLSSSVSASSSPSHLSPPKLQPTTHPNSPLF